MSKLTLKKARILADMTQVEMANALGIAESTYISYESYRSYMRMDTAWFDERIEDYPNAVSLIVNVSPNTTYYLNKHDTSNRFRVASFSGYPVNQSISNNISWGNSERKVFITGPNDSHLVVQVSVSNQEIPFSISIDDAYSMYSLPLN